MDLIKQLQKTMPLPQVWGTFHIVSIVITVALSVLFVFLLRKSKEKYLRLFLLVVWIVLVVLEVIKILGNCYNREIESLTFFPHVLPVAFCSLPLYLLPIVIFAKEGKFRNTIETFLALFGTAAGISVFLVPSTVFSELIFYNYHTMIYHGFMVITGLVMLSRVAKDLTLSKFLYSMLVLFLSFMVAYAANEIVHVTRPDDIDFNAFSISRYFVQEFPLVGNFKQSVPNSIFIICYMGVFVIWVLPFYIISSLVTHNKKWYKIANNNEK